MKKHEIHYCDSMAGNGSTALSILLDYLKDESISKKGIELSTQQWKLIDHRDTIPQQNNCTDCGVFTCMNCILACLQQVVLLYGCSLYSLLIIHRKIFHQFENFLYILLFMVVYKIV